jgi:hypothetical protein
MRTPTSIIVSQKLWGTNSSPVGFQCS